VQHFTNFIIRSQNILQKSVTYIIFKIVDMSVGVHVDKRVEEEGLDIYEHG